MKVAKIISTTCAPRTVREKTILAGSPPRYSTGSQNYVKREDVINLINLILKEESKSDPGTNVDLIIVNNSIGDTIFDNFIDQFHNTSYTNGKIFVVKSNNIGWSFGAYNAGFKKFKNNYDYFIFTEDDTLITRDNYASYAIDLFERIHNCGFVSYTGLSKSAFGKVGTETLHAHGGVGLSSKEVLTKVLKKNKNLPFCNNNSSYRKIILDGEVRFTNIISELGYVLAEIPDTNKFFDFAYDFQRGIDMPLRPTRVYYFLYVLLKKIRRAVYIFLKIIRIK